MMFNFFSECYNTHKRRMLAIEGGSEFVAGEYSDGGKIFRKPK
jgi:hypothetical protein